MRQSFVGTRTDAMEAAPGATDEATVSDERRLNLDRGQEPSLAISAATGKANVETYAADLTGTQSSGNADAQTQHGSANCPSSSLPLQTVNDALRRPSVSRRNFLPGCRNVTPPPSQPLTPPTPGVSRQTQYFAMDDDDREHVPPHAAVDPGASESDENDTQAAWLRGGRELELSKVSSKRIGQQQQLPMGGDAANTNEGGCSAPLPPPPPGPPGPPRGTPAPPKGTPTFRVSPPARQTPSRDASPGGILRPPPPTRESSPSVGRPPALPSRGAGTPPVPSHSRTQTPKPPSSSSVEVSTQQSTGSRSAALGVAKCSISAEQSAGQKRPILPVNCKSLRPLECSSSAPSPSAFTPPAPPSGIARAPPRGSPPASQVVAPRGGRHEDQGQMRSLVVPPRGLAVAPPLNTAPPPPSGLPRSDSAGGLRGVCAAGKRASGHSESPGTKSPQASTSELPCFGIVDSASDANEEGEEETAVEGDKQIQHMTKCQADQSLLPRQAKDSDVWCGWNIQTSRDGRLFYHHAESRTSQWHAPSELSHVLGEWELVSSQPGDARGGLDVSEASSYWRNELLGVSAWKDPRHTTNLFQAALDGNLFFLQLYTEVGGYLDAVDAKGRAALHYNCAGGSMQAVLYLLQSRASMDMPDLAGSTPLHWACRYGHTPIVRILLENRADPDVQNTLGDTSMHEAAALGHIQPLHWLILAKANPLLRNREMKTPAEVAERSQATEAEALLREQERNQCWRDRGRRGGSARGGGSTCARTDPSPLSEAASASASANGRRRSPRRSLAESVPADAGRAAVDHGGDASGSDSDPDAPPEPSLALVVVRVARPLLRGVQWLANRLLGEHKAENLAAANKLSFEEARSDAEDSEMSAASMCSTDDEDLGDVDSFSDPAMLLGTAHLENCNMAVDLDSLAEP